MQVAKIENNIVLEVIVAESVQWCIDTFGGEWVRTFYNTDDKNFAGIGFIYYPDKENFSSPQPYPSWQLDENCLWQPPIPYPNDGCLWTWDEENTSWINPICNSNNSKSSPF